MKVLKKVVIVLLVLSLSVSFETQIANAKMSSYISNKKYAGTYSYKGEEAKFETGWYCINIKKITSSGKINLVLDKGGRNGSPLYQTEEIKATIKGNTARFSYHEDGWGNKGKGTVVFKKNGDVLLTVKQTYTADWNRSSLALPRTVFKKIKKSRK